jgi:hypothetical protein
MICAVLAAVVAMGVMPLATAQAEEGRWCLRAAVGRGAVSEICHYRTFEACRNDLALWGTTSFCNQNQYYLPYWQGRGFGQEPQRKFVHKKKRRARAADR